MLPRRYPTKRERKCLDSCFLLNSLLQSPGFHLGTGNQLSRLGEDPRVKKSSVTTIVTEKLFSLLWAPTLLLCFLAGCPASSEWDRQWLEVQTLLQEGQLQEAKKLLLQDILPSVRHNGPSDTRYAQVIYQLGDIARLEGDTGQAESYYWEALPLIAQSLGPEHLHMADPLTELASLYQHKAQPKIALPLLKRALAIREKTWGTSDRQLLPTLKQYHILLMVSDDHKEPVQILTPHRPS